MCATELGRRRRRREELEEEEGVPGAVQTLPRDGPVPKVLVVNADDGDKMTSIKERQPEGKAQNIIQIS